MQEYGRTKGPYHKNWCCSLGIMHPLSSTWSVVPRTQMLLSGCRPTHVTSVRTCRDPMQFCSQLQSWGWGGLVLTCPKYVLCYSCLGWYILMKVVETRNKARFFFRDSNHITLFCSLAAHPSRLHNTALLPSCSPKATYITLLCSLAAQPSQLHDTALLPSCSPKSTLVMTLKLKLRSTSNPLPFFVLFHYSSSPWCSTSSSGETFRTIADR